MPDDVVDLIMSDHREVERLFAQLRAEPASRPGLTPVLTTLLTAHSRAEEAEVYPAAADEAGESEEVSHSQEEHLLADQLLADLAETDPASSSYEKVLAKLVEAVSHHIDEEEKTVLPGIRKGIPEKRRVELGDAFLVSRAEHLGKQPKDITFEELRQQAANAEIPVGDRNKGALAAELKKHASE